jgi:redox-sensitive bicupin YhaK (pirin superfamily)
MRDTLLLAPHGKDLGGGFTVRRLLPAAACRSVGPFVFFDHFGPVTATPADNHDVRAHPHIGLSTVTYLYEGAMQHHDSTGALQRIEPGAINWMTAGRGVVHSERTPPDLKGQVRRSHGLQLWAALPAEHEEVAPSFVHTPADALHEEHADGVRVRLLVGRWRGMRSPVRTWSPSLFMDLQLSPGARWTWPTSDTPEASERALYASAGRITLDGAPVPDFTMAVLGQGLGSDHVAAIVAGPEGARVAIIGGAPVGHRHLFWNFVSSRRERLAKAADDWAAGRFDLVPGETEFIPLPDRRLL